QLIRQLICYLCARFIVVAGRFQPPILSPQRLGLCVQGVIGDPLHKHRSAAVSRHLVTLVVEPLHLLAHLDLLRRPFGSPARQIQPVCCHTIRTSNRSHGRPCGCRPICSLIRRTCRSPARCD